MAQNSFDQLSKQYLEEFLALIGTVQRQYEIPGEAKFVDVWFVPNPEVIQTEDLGLLGRIVPKPLLEESGGVIKFDWMPGVYFIPDIFKTAIVPIDQLPETEETLWLRILGRDATQERAIREVLSLPSSHP